MTYHCIGKGVGIWWIPEVDDEELGLWQIFLGTKILFPQGLQSDLLDWWVVTDFDSFQISAE